MGGTSFEGVRIVEANMIWPEWITVIQCQNGSEERSDSNIQLQWKGNSLWENKIDLFHGFYGEKLKNVAHHGIGFLAVRYK